MVSAGVVSMDFGAIPGYPGFPRLIRRYRRSSIVFQFLPLEDPSGLPVFLSLVSLLPPEPNQPDEMPLCLKVHLRAVKGCTGCNFDAAIGSTVALHNQLWGMFTERLFRIKQLSKFRACVEAFLGIQTKRQ